MSPVLKLRHLRKSVTNKLKECLQKTPRVRKFTKSVYKKHLGPKCRCPSFFVSLITVVRSTNAIIYEQGWASSGPCLTVTPTGNPWNKKRNVNTHKIF